MMTSLNPWIAFLFTARCRNGLRRRMESIEDYQRSASTDETFELVHTLIMCDRREACVI